MERGTLRVWTQLRISVVCAILHLAPFCDAQNHVKHSTTPMHRRSECHIRSSHSLTITLAPCSALHWTNTFFHLRLHIVSWRTDLAAAFSQPSGNVDSKALVQSSCKRARREENDGTAAEDITDVYMGDGAERKGQELTYTDGPHFSYFDEVEHWKAPRTAPSS